MQVAAGPDRPAAGAEAASDFQYTMSTLGRLTDAGAVRRHRRQDRRARARSSALRDVARVELGAKSQDQTCTLDGKPSVGLADLPAARLERPGHGRPRPGQDGGAARSDFPPGLDYAIVYDTTPFIRESIDEVFKTLRDAIILVAIVVLVFLQNWRATIIPLIAVPVSLVGTFAVMAVLGFSLNNLSLFGLVLAIGIVVDDAIVVVENVERWIEHGLSPKRGGLQGDGRSHRGGHRHRLRAERGVHSHGVHLPGITGQFFRQFALTIAAATLISAFNSLTLSPALAAILLQAARRAEGLAHAAARTSLSAGSSRASTASFDATTAVYARLVRLCVRGTAIVLLVYGGLLWLTYLRLHDRADRLHSRPGQGLSAGQRPAARLGLAASGPQTGACDADGRRSPAADRRA